MRGSFDQELVERFETELRYLRQAGSDFARRYPKIAARLALSDGESADPQIERLLESFAFLTARIQARMDADFPEIPAALLASLHPHLVDSIPPLSIARFAVNPLAPPPPSGYLAKRGSLLYASAANGVFCRFRTCYDVDVRPIEIVEAQFEPITRHDCIDRNRASSVLRLRLAASEGSLADLSLDSIRVCLAGDRAQSMALYELLLSHVTQLVLVAEDALRPVPVSVDLVREVGFEDHEALLHDRPNGQPGFRLLQEYFAFPEKFLFFDIGGLGRRPPGEYVDILIGLSVPVPGRMDIGPDNFLLGCTPVINLFPKTTEPVRFDHKSTEYLLVPEAGAAAHYEIHSVQSVSVSSPSEPGVRVVQPYFGLEHDVSTLESPMFWVARRQAAAGVEAGTDTVLGLVELDFRKVRPARETALVRTLCTNRALAEQVPAGAALQGEVAIPALASLLMRPTNTVPAPADGDTLWRLVSHLSLNTLSLSNGTASRNAFCEILTLHCPPGRPAAAQEVQGIRSMAVRSVVRRLGGDVWRGFAQGTEVTLEFDERSFIGGNPLMLAAVINRFLSNYCAINSFTELVIRSAQREGEWKRWPPMLGAQDLI
jgi:type VI secretion system protein ImpG